MNLILSRSRPEQKQTKIKKEIIKKNKKITQSSKDLNAKRLKALRSY